MHKDFTKKTNKKKTCIYSSKGYKNISKQGHHSAVKKKNFTSAKY